MYKLAILLGLYCIGWFMGYATRAWIERGEDERLKAMYEAAKGDLDDVLRSRDEVTDLLEEAQR